MGSWASRLINEFCYVQVFYPLVIATSLFSTQGILPFTSSLTHFVYALLILVVLVVALLVVSLSWDSRFQPVIDYLMANKLFRKTIIMEQDQEIRDVSILLRYLMQIFFRTSTPSQANREMSLRPAPEGANFRSRTNSNYTAPLSLRNLMGFSYSPLSTSDREYHNLGGLPEGRTTWPTTDPLNPIVNWETETASPSSHFSRVRRPIYKRSPFRPFTSIKNILKRFLRQTPGADKQRIEWICVSKFHSVLLLF